MKISRLASATIVSFILISYASISLAANKSGKETPNVANSQIANIKSFQNWSYMCEPANKDNKEKTCYIIQVVSIETIDEKTKKKISTKLADYKIGYFSNEKGKKVIKFIETLPLGSLIAPGTGIVNEKGEIAKGAYSFCYKDGCIAITEISEEIVKKIISSEKSVIAFIANDGKQVNLPLAHEGLADAFKYLQANK